MSGPLGRWAEVALVAGLARREVGRRPGAWLATALTGVLFAGLLLMVGVVTERIDDRAETRSFKVAVGGDLEGGARLLERLRDDERLAVVVDDDPLEMVTRQQASAGIVLPPDADRATADDPVELFVSYRRNSPVSFEALSTVLAGVQEQEVELLVGDVPPPALTVSVVDLVGDDRVGRDELAHQVGAVSALLCLGVVTAVAGVLGAARERRALEPLLVLPLRRRSITAGVALGTLPVASLQVLAGVGLLVLTAAVPSSAAHQPGRVVVAMLVGGAAASSLLVVLACAVGSVAGALGTGSDDAVSLGDLLALPFVLVGIVLFAGQGIEASPALCLVPGLGQALLVREAVGGVASLPEVLAATVSTLVSAWALVAVAGRALADERRLLRSTG